MERILITGGSGLTGRALRRSVAGRDRRAFTFWSSADCDLSDATRAVDEVMRLRPDAILHLAAARGGVGHSARRPASLLRDNVRMGLNVLEAAREARVSKVVLCLSNGAYPAEAVQPYREEDLHAGPPHSSDYAYAHAKRLLEPMARAWREEHGLCVVTVSPNGIVGEDDRFDAEAGNMTAALIRRIHDARDGGGPIVVWGDGTPRRELSFAGDVARDLLWVLDHYDDPRVLNVGTSEEVSVRDVAFGVADLLGVDRGRIRFDPSRPSGIARRRSDTSRYRALSGARYLPFSETLRRAVAGFLAREARKAGADAPAPAAAPSPA